MRKLSAWRAARGLLNESATALPAFDYSCFLGRLVHLVCPAPQSTLKKLRLHEWFMQRSALLSPEDVLREFREAGALLEGHFILSSGLHSPVFLQKMFVFQNPARTERLCKALAATISAAFGAVDVVVSPALGAIVPGYETARQLGARAIFVEREAGRFVLRRGFQLKEGERVVLVEDIVTTGLSSRECLAALRGFPATLVGAACLIDRSHGTAALGVPLVSLACLDIPAYSADALPAALAALPAVKPGSRPAALDAQVLSPPEP